MKILVTGGCGFAGSELAQAFTQSGFGDIVAFDNFSRKGSERNRLRLTGLGIQVAHGDVRCPSDFSSVSKCDWIVDCAANPSVLAGVGCGSSMGVVESNLMGTVQLLELAKRWNAGLILLSTSRVYSMDVLRKIPLSKTATRFVPDADGAFPSGLSAQGIKENFCTEPPLSLYGSTKRASELLAAEYAYAYQMPVWINRCGVMAGGGQMGGPQQGIIAYWIHAVREKRQLRFTGFGGTGLQVRDLFHPNDLVETLVMQMKNRPPAGEAPVTVFGGGLDNSVSLHELHCWCEARWGSHTVEQVEVSHSMDIPWMVMDSTAAESRFGWKIKHTKAMIFEEIAEFAEKNENWLSQVL